MPSDESPKIRILIADDTNLIRRALTIYFEDDPSLKVVGTAENGNFVLRLIRELRPDIVLMDLEMPEMDGITATRIMRQFFPSVKVLVVSSHSNQDYIDQALKVGASGYFIKSTPASQLLKSIKLIYEQDVRIVPDITKPNDYLVLPKSLPTPSQNQFKLPLPFLRSITKFLSLIYHWINRQSNKFFSKFDIGI